MSWKWAQVFIVSPKLVPLTMPKKSFLENLEKVELNHVGLYPPQISLLPDGRPSLQGDALGCATLSRVQSRTYRGHITPALLETRRFSCAVIQLRNIEFLAVSIFGFPVLPMRSSAKMTFGSVLPIRL